MNLGPNNMPSEIRRLIKEHNTIPTGIRKPKKFIHRTRDLLAFKYRRWISDKLKVLAEWFAPEKEAIAFDKETKEMWSKVINRQIAREWGSGDNAYKEYKKHHKDGKGIEDIVLDDILAQEAVEEEKLKEQEDFKELKENIRKFAKDKKPTRSSVSAVEEIIQMSNSQHPKELFKNIDTYSKLYSPLENVWIRTINFKKEYLGLEFVYAFKIDHRGNGTHILGGYFKYSNRKPVSIGKFPLVEIVKLMKQLHDLGNTNISKPKAEKITNPAVDFDFDTYLAGRAPAMGSFDSMVKPMVNKKEDKKDS